MKLIRPRPTDFFLCQLYLFDREMWEEEALRSSPLLGVESYNAFHLSVMETRAKRVIQYYESFGFHFDPPEESLYQTAGRMAHMVDSGEWAKLGEFSGYPHHVPAGAG